LGFRIDHDHFLVEDVVQQRAAGRHTSVAVHFEEVAARPLFHPGLKIFQPLLLPVLPVVELGFVVFTDLGARLHLVFLFEPFGVIC
jgi:hypothetical protein